MSLGVSPQSSSSFCFPRVSGDEPVISPVVLEALVFSPRERG